MTRAASALLLAAGALLLQTACGAAPPPVDNQYPRVVGPLDPRVGVHTRLTDEPDAAKIARTTAMVRAMGAGSMVEYFPWAYFEPQRDQWDWSHPDLVMGEAARQGLRVYARIDLVPDWIRPVGSASRLLPPGAVDTYADAVARFAERYASSLAGIIVWNEPNVAYEWGFQPVRVDDYAQMLQETSTAVRQAAPGVRIFAAGLAPTLEQSDQALDDLDYLDDLYAAGAGAWIDGVAVHAYGWQSPPDEAPAPDRINFRRTELLRDVMVSHGDAAKPMIISEGGWSDYPRWTKAVHSAQRIAYTVGAYQLAAADWPWLESANFWVFRLPKPAHNYNDGYAFVASDFTPLPVYDAVQSYVESEVGETGGTTPTGAMMPDR